MTESGNAFVAEGLGEFFKNVGKKDLIYRKR